MHRGVRDKLEDILAGTGDALSERHLSECEDCSSELNTMREHHRLLQTLRPVNAPPELSAGFYARVMERIEAQGVASIWSLFFDSRVGRGLAMASMVVALSLGLYMVSSESTIGPESTHALVRSGGGLDGTMLTGSPDADAVLVNLVTYREQ